MRYERVARVFDSLRIAGGDGSYLKRLSALAKTNLLVLDDFGLKPLTQGECLDLRELIDDRHGRRSTIVTSQLPIANWHAYLGDDPTTADALLDRLLSTAHRLELKGESMRKREKLDGAGLQAVNNQPPASGDQGLPTINRNACPRCFRNHCPHSPEYAPSACMISAKLCRREWQIQDMQSK